MPTAATIVGIDRREKEEILEVAVPDRLEVATGVKNFAGGEVLKISWARVQKNLKER